MRSLFLSIALIISSSCFANTYSSCGVDSLSINETVSNIVVVNLGCTATDAMTSGSNCTGTPRSNAFLFDSSTTNGKAELSFLLAALAAGNTINASTYGACIPTQSDTLILYSLKINKR